MGHFGEVRPLNSLNGSSELTSIQQSCTIEYKSRQSADRALILHIYKSPLRSDVLRQLLHSLSPVCRQKARSYAKSERGTGVLPSRMQRKTPTSARDVEVLPYRPPQLPPELPSVAMIIRCVTSVLIQVPIRAPSAPHHGGEFFLNMVGIAILCSLLDFYHSKVTLQHGSEDRLDNVFDLGFVGIDDRVVGGEGIGTEDDTEVRESTDKGSLVCLSSTSRFPVLI